MYDDNKEVVVQPSYIQEIYAADHEFKTRIYQEQEDAKRREELAKQRAYNESTTSINNYINDRYTKSTSRAEYLSKVKDALVTECLLKIYTESAISPMTSRDSMVARNLITSFVRENGSGKLLREFRGKNLILSEFARICDTAYNKLLEKCDNCGLDDIPDLKLDTTISDSFFDDLKDIDCHAASELIRDKVADSLTEFIDSNMDAKLEYEELLNNAKDQAAVATTEEAANDIINNANRAIAESRVRRQKNVFGYMVEALTKKALSNDDFKKIYTNENGVDMDAIVNDVQNIYSMLEMVNTLDIVPVNEEFILHYINSL
jgi:hypothetical protein